MADRWAGIPPRFEVLRHGENARDVPQRSEFHAALPEHVAPGEWGEEIRATVRANAREDALCGSSPGTRDQRVRVLRFRRSSGSGDGRAWGLGSDFAMAWAKRKARASADDSFS